MTRFILIFSLLLFAMHPAYSQSATLWEIGKYDHSSLEFSRVPHDRVSYQIGKSDWTKDWPGEQETGSTYEIQFDLNAAPHGTFSLKISTIIYSPGICLLYTSDAADDLLCVD